jgi:hypothetical protein
MLGSQKRPKFFSLYILVVGAIFSATVFLVLLGSFRGYQSQISIMVISKTESASLQASEVVENLKSLSRRLSFYENLISQNKGLKDLFPGKSRDEKKALWNKMFQIERGEGGTILTLTLQNAKQTDALLMAKQAAFTLINTASRYYDIKTDFDFRIIEEPTVRPYVRNWLGLALISLLLGYVASFLVVYVFESLLSKNQTEENFDIEQKSFKLAFPREKKVSLERIEKLDYPVMHEHPVLPEYPVPVSKAAAPENLPVGEEFLDFVEPLEDEAPAEGDTEIENDLVNNDLGMTSHPAEVPFSEAAPDPNREPSEDEYRQRLNELLKGKL